MSFSEISLLLVAAAIFGVIARLFKQPLLIGFLFAGLILSSLGFVNDNNLLTNMGKIGVTLLLFLVGMQMNLRNTFQIGKTAVIVGVGQIFITSIIGFLLVLLLGLNLMSSIYVSIALTFSSTIIIVKLLTEKDDINSLYGKISVGVLLVQDLVIVLILMFLAGLETGSFNFLSFILLIFKAAVLFISVWYLSKDILPRIFTKLVGGSQELLFTVSIAWALGIATLVGGPLGFSFEIGGFLAGLALSNLSDHLGISSKTKSLRDFFLTIFFVTLGSQLLVTGIQPLVPKIIILSLFVLIGNPLIVLVLMGILGHKSRTSFQTSVTVAQVSEFSFILMAMGKSLGHITSADLVLVVMVGAITMIGSSYLILGSEKIYLRIKNILKFFERQKTKESIFVNEINFSDHVVLVGCDKIGSTLLSYFRRHNINVVVVDFNPTVFSRLTALKENIVLGDITDPETLETIKLEDSKIVICTVPNLEENISIINTIRVYKRRPIFIATASSKEESINLYERGADYVLNPDLIAGEFLRHLFVNHGFNQNKISKMGKSHFNRLAFLRK